MKNKTMRIMAMMLCVLMCVSMFMPTTLAADTGYNYWNHTEPSGADYAYWNGSRMVKHSGTYVDNVKWMQAMFNWFIWKGYISGSRLVVDGSFGPASKNACIAFQKRAGISADGKCGPATIARMKTDRDGIISGKIKINNGYNLVWPTNTKYISGKYGTNGSLRSNGTRYHSGIDIGSAVGAPCYATADGVVIMCRSTDDSTNTIGGRGRYIVIYHSNGNFSSLYEHLNSVNVKVGDSVKAGQKIGTTGNSGWQSKNKHYAAHLHFGLMYGKMTNMGYDLWTVPGKSYNGKTYKNNTFDPDPNYNSNIHYTYK